MHTARKLVDSDKYIKPNKRSRSVSNAIRDADIWQVSMPRKNSSTVAQYVIDSFSVVEYGSGVYTSLTSYIVITYKETSKHSVNLDTLFVF